MRASPSPRTPRHAAAGAVKSVRMSRSPPGNFRLVLDLAGPIQAKSFLSTPNAHYGYRLVVDLGSANRADKPIKVKHAPSDARDLIIAIDAGHGGEDPGAIGKNGTREKDVVLAIARELALKINAEPGMKAVLTRGGDYFVPLRDRMRRARAQQADLFVFDSRRFNSRSQHRRLLGVYPVAAGRDRRGIAMAG